MKIIVINEISRLGGAEVMAIELANTLNSMPGYKIVFASAPGILMERLNNKIEFIPISRYSLSNIFKLFFEFKTIFRRERFDIIHAQGATIGIIAGITARIFSSGTKIIITHHSSNFTRTPPCVANFLLKTVTDMLVAISKVKYDSFIRAGLSNKKITLIPNFVNREYLLSQANPKNIVNLKNSLGVLQTEKVILGIGRLLPSKRFDIFIQTLVDCARRAPDIKIFGIILGDGPELRHLQDLINQYNFPNLRIKLLGFQHNVAAYFKITNIFLFPSEHEVLPMCLIEATSLGVPIVCSNIPGNTDIVENGFNGLLVDPIKMDYSNSILCLLKDNVLANNLSLNGIKKAMNEYDKDKVINNIIALYNSMVNVNGG